MSIHIIGKVPAGLAGRSPAVLLEMELAHEKAVSIGRFGRLLEGALQELVDFDAAHPPGSVTSPEDQHARAALLSAAARALWCFIVQRECAGLFDSEAMIEEYQVPAEVQRAMRKGL